MKPNTISLNELSQYLDDFLHIKEFDENAMNGVQVANNNTPISKIGTAVSASLEVIEKAASMDMQALIVHHGIFLKNEIEPMVGMKYQKIKRLIKHNIALLCYHLPLDAHQEIGNNWRAAQDLGLQNLQPFPLYHKIPIGVIGSISPMLFFEFKKKVEDYYKRHAESVKVKDPISSVAIVSGGAEKLILSAAQAGADCFITGRVDEPTWDHAHENNISFLGLGHYATEVVGPRALAAQIQQKFSISCEFIRTDNPF